MYNLIVSSVLPDLSEGDPVEVSRSRFLEHTNDSIKIQLRTLSIEAIAAIRSWPALVMAEGKGVERAYIATINDLRLDRSEISVRIRRFRTSRPILNDHIWKNRDVLDIGQFEFSRHHWAIKDSDVI